jgi:serine protease AprX
MFKRKALCFILLNALMINVVQAGVSIVKSNGITLTGADGVNYIGTNGITLTGADGFLSYQTNGITLTGADGITLTGADGITLTGADGSTYTGADGITLTGADGITLTGADGITLTGADGITLTGADGTQYQANSIVVRQPDGITLTGADGITLTGADGLVRTSSDGITLTGADGITLTGADGITLTGADGIVGINTNGIAFTLANPTGITLTGADGITLTGADGITLTGADGITLTGADAVTPIQNSGVGIQNIDPELAVLLNNATDDSNINAVIVFHQYPTANDLAALREKGITGGTQYTVLPMIMVSAPPAQLISASFLPQVRSIYSNRTLSLNSDPYFQKTQLQRASGDADLRRKNFGTSLTGSGVTVAVLDTGVNGLHNDLSGKVVQNVRLADAQGAPQLGFINPIAVENVPNTDLAGGHGTFVSGVIAASGTSSNGKYNGVAPGANILGLSAGDLNLSFILAGFDYLLRRGADYNVKVVNCSFSANTLFDYNDPVNIATKMLTERGVNVVFSAGNEGAGNGTLNPYAVAPWVVSVGSTNEKGQLSKFSSRGLFGSAIQNPSIVAPGENIVSLRGMVSQTSAVGLVLGADRDRLTPTELPFYTTASGTSFSAPQVAGAIALMLEANPNLTPKDVKDILQRTATPLPQYFRHEAGAGMLNTYAAVLEAAFPERKMGIFRSVLDRRAVEFSTSQSQIFENTVVPNASVIKTVSVPSDTIQAGVHIAWALSSNDLALRVYDENGVLKGESNDLNAPGLSGRREKVILNYPEQKNYQAVIQNTGNLGTTAQTFTGIVETTRVSYADLNLQTLSPQNQAMVKESLRSFLMLPQGSVFQPNFGVTRAELAAAIIRAGRVPQYVAATPMFSDVNDLTTRSVVETVQSNPNGKLFYDASNGGAFRPDVFASKLVAAVALVKAANMENLTVTATLPLSVTDAASIPLQWRGYAAVALQKGFLSLDGNAFNPNRSLTRLELAQALVNIKNLPAQ